MLKIINRIIIVIAVLGIGLAAWLNFTVEPTSFKEVVIKDQVFLLEIADTPNKLIKGLAGREQLADNQGMLFIFPQAAEQSFWMKGMKFEIDLLWLDDVTIVGWEQNMALPASNSLDTDLPKYTSKQPVNAVLELPAGTIDRLGLEIGDIVDYR